MLFKVDFNQPKDESIIKDYFIRGGEYVIIQNAASKSEVSDKQILKYYTKLGNFIGTIQSVNAKKYTDNNKNDLWVDVKYDKNFKNDKPWKSNSYLKLHTDNTLSNSFNYANLTQLVCLEPSKFSGHTTFISNKKIVELIKYNDSYEKTNLFQKIINLDINHSLKTDLTYFKKRKLLEVIKTQSEDEYVFSFNYTQSNYAINNNDTQSIIQEFDNFLEEKVMMSNLMTEIRLNRGDSIIFNDEKVMHGRRSVIGSRHYIKCGILCHESSIIDYKNL